MSFLKASTRAFYRLADAVICVSRGSARDLARLSGLDEDRITVVYNPVPKREVTRHAAEARMQWKTSGSRILAVGTLKHQKNHALLISSLARLPAGLNASLVIAGEGELRDELELQVQKLGLADRVTFTGFVKDLGDYYSAADLFVLSSDYEGFALVVVEALQAGLRIVSTDCPDGPAEILEGGRYGTLVPVGDAARLAAAIEATLQAPATPQIQQRRAADFSTSIAANKYLALMLGSGSSDRAGTDDCAKAVA